MRPLVECVPNFSEGRRREVVEAIVEAIRSVPGATVLDWGMDPDHNRAVVTFVGAPAPVEEAAFRGAAKATELIDISHHEGVHPRIGATDVVPFVPIGDMPMESCVELAKRFGARVGEQLGIPAFLYAEASENPRRKDLADLRRGGVEGLARAMADDAAFRPDFGPAALHPTAGGIATGARFFLVAFNVDLDTDDLSVADDIAKRIRASSGGGLEGVKALGFRLRKRGNVQVSMNVTDYRKCSMGRVHRRIEELCRERGVKIRSSEVVGMVPRAALVRAAEESLGLELDRNLVLEDRLDRLVSGPAEVHDFLDAIASKRPSPGGGAAAAMAGSLGAAAATKVFAIVKKRLKKAGEAVDSDLKKLLQRMHELRWNLLELVDRDADAYKAYSEAKKLPRGTEEEIAARTKALAAALQAACDAPLATAEAAVEAMRGARRALDRADETLLADAVAASALLRGAVDAATAMLRTNLPQLPSAEAAAALRTRFEALRAEARAIDADIDRALPG